MIIWAENRHQADIVFWTYELRTAVNGKRRPQKIRIDCKDLGISNQIHLSLVNLWEASPDCFMLACNCNKERIKASRANNHNYLYDVKTGLLRETKFAFEGSENECLIDQQSFGEYSIFPTFSFKDGKALNSPAYLVHNPSETIAAQVVWRCEAEFNFYVPGYESNSLLMAQFPPGDVREISITRYMFVSPKDVYLRFMLQINEDFDDDLLQDAIEMLEQ
jgi:hypothetical protein